MFSKRTEKLHNAYDRKEFYEIKFYNLHIRTGWLDKGYHAQDKTQHWNYTALEDKLELKHSVEFFQAIKSNLLDRGAQKEILDRLIVTQFIKTMC